MRSLVACFKQKGFSMQNLVKSMQKRIVHFCGLHVAFPLLSCRSLLRCSGRPPFVSDEMLRLRAVDRLLLCAYFNCFVSPLQRASCCSSAVFVLKYCNQFSFSSLLFHRRSCFPISCGHWIALSGDAAVGKVWRSVAWRGGL